MKTKEKELATLIELNDWFLQLPFEEVHIDTVIHGYSTLPPQDRTSIISECFDFLASKHDGNLALESQSALQIARDAEFHPVIKACVNYLLCRCGDENSKGLLKDACDAFALLFFDKLQSEQKTHGLPNHSLVKMLEWEREMNPAGFIQTKKRIIDLLLQRPSGITMIMAHHIAYDLPGAFSGGDIASILSAHEVIRLQSEDVETYFSACRHLLCTPSLDKKVAKRTRMLLCKFAIEHIDSLSDHFKQIELQLVLEWMSESTDLFEESQFVMVRNEIESANQRAISRLQSFRYDLPKDLQKKANEEIDKQTGLFIKMDSATKIDCFLMNIPPVRKAQIIQQMEDAKKQSAFGQFFETHYMDREGRIINYKKLPEEDMFAVKAEEFINRHISITMPFYLNPFFRAFPSGDEKALEYTKYFLSQSSIPLSRDVESKAKLFQEYFEGKFEDSVAEIIMSFESDLRGYFKRCGFDVHRKNRPQDVVSLSTFLNHNPENRFRDKLCETIDDDFYFTLEYFLTNEYGFALRDRLSHDGNIREVGRTLEGIYCAAMIIKLYWGMRKEQ